MRAEIDIHVSPETVHKTCGVWYFQPDPDTCIPFSAWIFEREEYVITGMLEYWPGTIPARTGNPDSAAYADPGEAPEIIVTINREMVPLSADQLDQVAEQIHYGERPSVYMDVYKGTPRPHDVKSEIARLNPLTLAVYVSTSPSIPWILPFAAKRIRHLRSVGRAI